MFKKLFNLNKLSTLLLYTSILIFIIAFNFAHNPPSGWYQQFLPNLGGRGISDIFFLDSLTGWAVTQYIDLDDTAHILKTTNGGNNWNIVHTRTGTVGFSKIYFLNPSVGFVCGTNDVFGYKGFSKSTNGGINWMEINVPEPFAQFNDMSVLNEDTIWLASNSTGGGLYRTTNGGQNWELQFNKVSGNPEKVYFYNKDIGFITDNTNTFLWKTTNSGVSWSLLSTNDGFFDIYFADSLNGWKCNEGIQKTTNGGLNWQSLFLPPKGTPVIYNGIILLSRIKQFSNISNDIIWGVGSEAFFGSGRSRGLIYKSTDGGNSWGFQLPDTSINIPFYFFSNFTNKLNGWSYHLNTGVHTVSGGDSITYTSVHSHSTKILDNYFMHQNYPNPFNPTTKITYELRIGNYVEIEVINIQGEIIRKLVNKKQTAGSYEIEFNATGLSSGIYFYSLFINNELVNTKKMILIR